MSRTSVQRQRIPFRSVNRRGEPGHDPEHQRHHLLPLQLLSKRCFGSMFEEIGLGSVGFDDFRSNGLLLPASEKAALGTGRPLHRGPHGIYNEMVIERVGGIEAGWSDQRQSDTEAALEQALMRLELLQKALRRRLLDPAREPFPLNRKDPLRTRVDFSELDAMADTLWGESEDD
ncbi:MAG: AHH domain-containing protein [Novosphingobium sp.]|nr:AHH domain-containing protein [Novosphingobium sp.]